MNFRWKSVLTAVRCGRKGKNETKMAKMFIKVLETISRYISFQGDADRMSIKQWKLFKVCIIFGKSFRNHGGNKSSFEECGITRPMNGYFLWEIWVQNCSFFFFLSPWSLFWLIKCWSRPMLYRRVWFITFRCWRWYYNDTFIVAFLMSAIEFGHKGFPILLHVL